MSEPGPENHNDQEKKVESTPVGAEAGAASSKEIDLLHAALDQEIARHGTKDGIVCDGTRDSTARPMSPATNLLLSASPPRFISFEELMMSAESAANMALAHEIAVDNNFRLEKYESPEKSLQRQVKETMHRAFWDAFQEKLDNDPPDYGHALTLLQEVKDALFSLLLPSQERMKQHIDERIDLEVIQNQLSQQTLNLREYAAFVIELMAKLCAPARDEQVAALHNLEKPVDIFKSIFEVLELMKMDMANFTIMQMRPYIQQQSVQYERTKFQNFLDTQRGVGIDGLELTRKWICQSAERVKESSAKAGAGSKITPRDILTEAYMELLVSNFKDPFPEAMVMDESRFLVLGDKLRQLVFISSVILVTCNLGGQSVQSLANFKTTVKEHIFAILQDVTCSGGLFLTYHLLMPHVVQADVYKREFSKYLDSIADQVVKDTNEALKSVSQDELDENRQRLLKTQVKEAVNKDHPVNKLIRERLHAFVRSTLSSEHKTPLQLPPGLSTVGKELSELCGALMRLTAHNRAVFGPHYSDIIDNFLKPTQPLLMS